MPPIRSQSRSNPAGIPLQSRRGPLGVPSAIPRQSRCPRSTPPADPAPDPVCASAAQTVVCRLTQLAAFSSIRYRRKIM
jgi:hypothetical protein